MNVRRGNGAVTVLIIMAAIALVAVGGYLLLGRGGSQIESNRQAAEDIFDINKDAAADWKTYRNEKYGFEFSYPQELTLREIVPPQYFVGTVLQVVLDLPQNNNSDLTGILVTVRTPNKTKVNSSFYIPPAVKTITDLRAQIEKNNNESEAAFPNAYEKIYMDFTMLSINRVEALQVDLVGGGGIFRYILFLQNDLIYEVLSRKTPFVDEKVTLQIAKTLRFTK